MRERLVIIEGDGADLLPDVVVREPAPANDIRPMTGPARGEYEEALAASRLCWCDGCVERREEEAAGERGVRAA